MNLRSELWTASLNKLQIQYILVTFLTTLQNKWHSTYWYSTRGTCVRSYTKLGGKYIRADMYWHLFLWV